MPRLCASSATGVIGADSVAKMTNASTFLAISVSMSETCFSGVSAVAMVHSISGCSLAHSFAHQTTPAVQPWSAAGMDTPIFFVAVTAAAVGAGFVADCAAIGSVAAMANSADADRRAAPDSFRMLEVFIVRAKVPSSPYAREPRCTNTASTMTAPFTAPCQ